MAYGKKYTGEFYADKGELITVDIYLDSYSGSVGNLTFSGSPVFISRGGSDDNMNVIIPSTATIEILSETKNEYIEFRSINDKNYYVHIYSGSTNLFIGYLLGEQYKVSYTNYDYTVELKAINGLEDLKYYSYRPDADTKYIGQESIISILDKCFELSGLNDAVILGANTWLKKIGCALKTYEDDFDSAETDSPLDQSYVYNERFYDEKTGDAWNCYDVVSALLQIFDAKLELSLSVGTWTYFIYETATILNDEFECRLFDGVTYDDNETVSGIHKQIGENLYWINNDVLEQYDKMYNNAVVDFHPGLKDDELIKNGDFIPEKWSDSSTPIYWTKNNSVTVSQETGNILRLPGYIYTAPTIKYISTVINMPPRHSALKINVRYALGGEPASESVSIGVRITIHNGTSKTYDGYSGLWVNYDQSKSLLLPLDWETDYDLEIEIPAPYYQSGLADMEVNYYQVELEGCAITDVGGSATGVFTDFKYLSVKIIPEEGNELTDSYIFEKEVNAYTARKSRKSLYAEQLGDSLRNTATQEKGDLFKSENNTLRDIYFGDLGSDTNDIIYYDSFWGGIYESDGTRTLLWKLRNGSGTGEGGNERIYNLLASKIKWQAYRHTQLLEGSVQHTLAGYGIGNILIDPDNISDDGLRQAFPGVPRMFYPVYSELNLKSSITTAFWKEIKYYFGDNLLTGWTNWTAPNDFDTFANTGANITSAIEASGSVGAETNYISLTAGYKMCVVIDITLNSGTIPIFLIGSPAGDIDIGTMSEGVNTIVFDIPTTSTYALVVKNYNGSAFATNFSASCELRKILNN